MSPSVLLSNHAEDDLQYLSGKQQTGNVGFNLAVEETIPNGLLEATREYTATVQAFLRRFGNFRNGHLDADSLRLLETRIDKAIEQLALVLATLP